MPIERAQLDAWGLPQSTASRRETEDMLARVGRSESETSEIFGRIEEQLRGLSRRLDSSERSHSESNRVLSRTAQEINIASREQAQAFDQLGMNVIALSERLERVERAAANDGIREAVKALHQGLSRLADQASQTASQSAAQVSNLATSLEQLALRLGAVRADADDTDKQLAQRILGVENLTHNKTAHLDDRLARLESCVQAGLETLEKQVASVKDGTQAVHAAAEQRLEQRLADMESDHVAANRQVEERFARIETGQAGIEQRFDQRLAGVEKTVEVHTNAIDHALEKIEAAANARAADQVEAQRRAASMEENLQGLRDAIMRLESRGPDTAIAHRLDNVEHNLGGLIARLEQDSPAAPLQQSLDALAGRIEALEKDHNDLLAEVRTGGTAETVSGFEAPDFPQQAFAPEQTSFGPAEPSSPTAGFAVPPFPEPEPGFGFRADAASSGALAEDGEPFRYDDPTLEEKPGFTGSASAAVDSFEEPGFAEPFAPEAEPENFLAQARRTARAAAEKAENERQNRGFHWGRTANTEDRPSYLIPAAIALIVVLAVAAGLMLSQRMRASGVANSAMPATPARASTVASTPAHATQARSTPARPTLTAEKPQPVPASPAKAEAASVSSAQAGQPQDAQQSRNAAPQGSQAKDVQAKSTPAKSTPAKGSAPDKQQHDARKVPTAPVRATTAAHKASVDRVTQLANASNPVAQTILGLRYLDGTGGTAVNLPEAVKYLTAAAHQGQAVAQYRLGTLYERGQGVAADGAKAAHWYQLAAEQGNRKAMHNLAVAFASGAAGKKNMAEAARWFAKAAALGLSDSQFNLAVLYERGDGVPQSLLDAYKWYSIAAAAGDTESKARVAVLQSQLSDADRAAAQKAAAAFHAAPLSRAANVSPEAADLS